MSSNPITEAHRSRNGGEPPAGRLPASVVAVILISLAAKLLLLEWNRGEYTDGIVQLQLWNSPIVFFPPGYTLAAHALNVLTGDLLIAGRAVSILASVACLAVFYRLAAAVLRDRNAAFFALLFLALSPVFNRWSIRVMTDSLFCLMFTACCWILFEIAARKEAGKIPLLLGLCGLASLVRYQGFFFLPFIAWLAVRHRGGLGNSGWRVWAGFAAAAVPWAALAAWIAARGFGHAGQFAERASHGLLVTAVAYWTSFETYVLYFPWAATYGLAAAGLAGLCSMLRGGFDERRFAGFFLLASLAFLVAQSAFLSFQYRYMLPLVPLWCVLGAKGVAVFGEWLRKPAAARAAAAAVAVNLALMTAAVLYLQRDTFGALAESAKYLREVGTDSRVLSDETYGRHAANVKMEFWSGREIGWLGAEEPKAGDIVVLHNEYTPKLAEIHQALMERFDVVVLRRWGAEEFATIPLLPDIMVNPPVPLTSNPECMAFRFAPQGYIAAVLRLNEK